MGVRCALGLYSGGFFASSSISNNVNIWLQTPGGQQVRDMDFWRVGSDGDAIHLGDLVLVRLRQVGKGTWVPELDLLDWERTI